MRSISLSFVYHRIENGKEPSESGGKGKGIRPAGWMLEHITYTATHRNNQAYVIFALFPGCLL